MPNSAIIDRLSTPSTPRQVGSRDITRDPVTSCIHATTAAARSFERQSGRTKTRCPTDSTRGAQHTSNLSGKSPEYQFLGILVRVLSKHWGCSAFNCFAEFCTLAYVRKLVPFGDPPWTFPTSIDDLTLRKKNCSYDMVRDTFNE